MSTLFRERSVERRPRVKPQRLRGHFDCFYVPVRYLPRYPNYTGGHVRLNFQARNSESCHRVVLRVAQVRCSTRCFPGYHTGGTLRVPREPGSFSCQPETNAKYKMIVFSFVETKRFLFFLILRCFDFSLGTGWVPECFWHLNARSLSLSSFLPNEWDRFVAEIVINSGSTF